MFAAAAALVAAAFAPAAAGKSRKVTSLPVAFQVRNTNTTAVPCTPDGATYTVRGHLTAPARGKRSGVAVYLHGLGLGEWLWNFQAVKRYGHARAMAQSGHHSITIDRLGYGASDKPDGSVICIGSHADIAHQIVGQLRAGTYTVTGGAPRKFKRVALVGHSAAGQIALTEAYTYRDVNALAVVGFSFSNLPRANEEFGFQRNECNRGGLPATPQRPPNYALFGQTSNDFVGTMFFSAQRSVREAAIPLQYPDPCGDNLSLIAAIARQPASAGKVKVPVLVACGRRDVLYAPFGCEAQAERFRRGRTLLVPNAGHGLPLERSWPKYRKRFSRWLDRYGF
jgi:pimeloyl-ACP methyl ester carboxylesterase